MQVPTGAGMELYFYGVHRTNFSPHDGGHCEGSPRVDPIGKRDGSLEGVVSVDVFHEAFRRGGRKGSQFVLLLLLLFIG